MLFEMYSCSKMVPQGCRRASVHKSTHTGLGKNSVLPVSWALREGSLKEKDSNRKGPQKEQLIARSWGHPGLVWSPKE